jgi:glutathione S-transferase
MSKPVLYHVPPSFYSQLVRLALAEKGIAYEGRYVIPGPPFFASYAPWYMRLNPGGTVPTLIHHGNVLAQSRDILGYIETRFPEPALWGNRHARIEIDYLVSRLFSVPFRELSYGSPRIARLGAWINSKRVRNLRRRRAENPNLSPLYTAKINDIEGFSRKSQDPHHMQGTRLSVEFELDQLEDVLGGSRCLGGADYTMADLVWTVGVARLIMLGMTPLQNRPALCEWYARMKSRPSFAEAGVMERFQPSAILRVLWAKFRQTGDGSTPAIHVNQNG